MKIILLILIATPLVILNLNAKIFYVNGISGNDTLEKHDGLAKVNAFKTIKTAISKAKRGDVIKIEGKHDGKAISYSESIVINSALEELKLTGDNQPVLDGAEIAGSLVLNAGIVVRARGVVIEGLIIRNFINDFKNEFGFNGGAAILLAETNTTIITKNNIENCNYGILSIDSEYFLVQDNKFEKFPKTISGDDKTNGGIGICIISDRNSLQKCLIGNEAANTINDADKHGIFMGRHAGMVLADYTEIKNNMIRGTKSGAALSMKNLEGVVTIEKNRFEANNHALHLEGNMIDMWIAENHFKGSKSNFEITSDESYGGSLVYDIWKNNKNIFDVSTYSVVMKRNKILPIERKRYIWNNEVEAKKHLTSTTKFEQLSVK